MSKDSKTTMGDRGPDAKPEEQYPLLKVDGGGDSTPAQTVLTPGWGVQCSRKKPWCSRWPEVMTACWMTLILFGISFLVFYAMGMGAYHRHQFVFVKCNSSKPASNVFYHHLMQRGEQVPFLWHSEYLSNMATQYPRLHFNVIFLIDDSYTARPKQNRYINKLNPYYPYGSYGYKTDETFQQAMAEFQSRFQNVNVTIMPLSKYMAKTPLRFKWRTIPTSYLPFYARVFSVWENGGIGMDLDLQRVYEDNDHDNRKKATILKQHNDGIKPESYVNALNKIDSEDDSALFAIFFGLVNRVLNETRSFFNKTLTFTPPETKPVILIRTHRAKRDVSDDHTPETTYAPKVLNSSVENVEQSNNSDPLVIPPHLSLKLLNDSLSSTANHSKLNATGAPQVVLIYDFQIVSDSIGPSYLISEPLVLPAFGTPDIKRRGSRTVKNTLESYLLSIAADGTFVAASSRQHPFLGHLISSGCQRTAPKFAIQDARLSQCSGFLREDVYCSNIFIL